MLFLDCLRSSLLFWFTIISHAGIGNFDCYRLSKPTGVGKQSFQIPSHQSDLESAVGLGQDSSGRFSFEGAALCFVTAAGLPDWIMSQSEMLIQKFNLKWITIIQGGVGVSKFETKALAWSLRYQKGCWFVAALRITIFFFFLDRKCQRAEISADCSHTTPNIFMLCNEAENGPKICQNGTLRGNHPEDISSVLSF